MAINDSEEDLRLYCFVHSYLSGIQKGVQSVHAVSQLMRDYHGQPGFGGKIVTKWAARYETVILLEGGNCSNLNRLANLFPQSKYPWSAFYEDESLYNAITAVAIVVPKSIALPPDNYDTNMSPDNAITEAIRHANLAV